MRLAVFSDIHGNLTALEAALADLQASGGADHIWFLGDYSALGARPAEVIDRVREMIAAVDDDEAKKHTIRAISGNTDRYIVTGERPPGKAVEDADALGRMRMTMAIRDTSINWATEQIDFDRYQWLAKLGGETRMHVDGYGYVLGYHACRVATRDAYCPIPPMKRPPMPFSTGRDAWALAGIRTCRWIAR